MGRLSNIIFPALDILRGVSGDVTRRIFKHTPRIIPITGPIDFDTVDLVSASLHQLNEESDDAIEVRIHSPGGMLACGMAIHDLLIQNRTCPIITTAYGCAHSAAGIILQAGHIRLVSPNTSLLVHNVRTDIDGMLELNDTKKLAEEWQRQQDKADRILADKSGQSLEVIREWCDNERIFHANEAVEAGLADYPIAKRLDLFIDDVVEKYFEWDEDGICTCLFDKKEDEEGCQGKCNDCDGCDGDHAPGEGPCGDDCKCQGADEPDPDEKPCPDDEQSD